MALKLVLQLICLLCLINASAAASLAKPGCPDTCGNISLPYPFGIGENCYMNKSFEVTCNLSFNPPKPFLNSFNLEVLEISVLKSQVTVGSPNVPSCNDSVDLITQRIDLEGSPFFISEEENIFATSGCDNFAFLSESGNITAVCTSICSGMSFCRLQSTLQNVSVTVRNTGVQTAKGGCKYAFLVPDLWSESPPFSSSIPTVIKWTFSDLSEGICDDGRLFNPNGDRYTCFCKDGYEGNPYLDNGCQDIDECKFGYLNSCVKSSTICVNTEGNYSCECRTGYKKLQSDDRYCVPDNEESRKGSVSLAIGIGLGLGVGLLFLLLLILWFYQVLKKRRNKKLKEMFFKRNGGLLLQQQVSSKEGSVERSKIFTAEELDKATDNYNDNRILGQGGQGTVYKGMLTDGRIVAIKKSKIVNESQIEQFINEVAILSQINHRNVVKLLGCCLETEVPLLVYEFISNGTLFHYLHDHSDDFPRSWNNHLRIAKEVSGALAYLHSAASIPIYHRDIKSTNILLNDKYTAKVSDFGISRSIPTDKTHLTTLVQGTFGYLDPEYFQSSQFTDKSDVYSFGVVLVELLTGEKPISSTRTEDKRNLATHFLSSMRENRLFEILDAQVAKEAGKEELEIMANLAKRCLNMNGRKRPTMKEVAMELEGLKMSQGNLSILQKFEESFVTEPSSMWDAGSIETTSSNVKPLLFNESTSIIVRTI